MPYRQKIKPVHRGDSFLSGEISSLLLAVHPGSLLSPDSPDSNKQLPRPCVSVPAPDGGLEGCRQL